MLFKSYLLSAELQKDPSIMIGVLDFGFGNVGSVVNMLTKIGATAVTVKTPEELESCAGIILPGVGAFDKCLAAVKADRVMFDSIEHQVLIEKIPFLGICVGMQMLFDSSEEGSLNGFGWISGSVNKFRFDDATIKVPHMGWSSVRLQSRGSNLLGDSNDSRFYFVHSYFAKCDRESDVLATATFGGREFCAAVKYQNIYGVQFHPEKSHKFGFALLKNFAGLLNVEA